MSHLKCRYPNCCCDDYCLAEDPYSEAEMEIKMISEHDALSSKKYDDRNFEHERDAIIDKIVLMKRKNHKELMHLLYEIVMREQSETEEEQAKVDKMVARFLNWKLPENFKPDAGITFNPEYNIEYMAMLGEPPMRHEPTGTNLFDADQAREMIQHMLGITILHQTKDSQ